MTGFGGEKNVKTGLAKGKVDDYFLPSFFGRTIVACSRVCERAAELKEIMAVKIRLKRAGAKNNPVFRIVVADQRSPRDGKFIEEIGTYWPLKAGSNFNVDVARADYWVSKGAQPSDTVASFLKKAKKAAAAA